MFINPAWGQSFLPILSKLDQKYYYPQSHGLKSVSARVQWEQLDVASGSEKFLPQPDFIFTWKANSTDGLGRFNLADGQEGERFQELARQIYPFRELIIPLTLKQKFSEFEGQVQKMKGGKLMIKLMPSMDANLSYKLLVDPKELVIRKVRFQQTRSPENVEGEMNYLKLDGKFAISESRSRFEVKGQEYIEITRFKYKKAKGIWWVHRIDQTLKQEDHVLRNLIFKLSDYRPILPSQP